MSTDTVVDAGKKPCGIIIYTNTDASVIMAMGIRVAGGRWRGQM